MQFSTLSLSPVLLCALEQEGYTTPTPIQAQAIPHILAGKDVLGVAQTGTGKTAAFTLPLLSRMMATPVDKSHRGPHKARALILSPTRELACQIADAVGTYGRDSGLVQTVIYGGVSQFHQERALKRGVDIIVATPGRLLDLMQQRIVDLSAVTTLILDEADRMLDMGFIKPIKQIAAATPSGRQTLLFSATMPSEIQKLAASLLRDPVRVTVEHAKAQAPKIAQTLYMVPRQQKQSLLELLLKDPALARVVVFTKTKHGADRVGRKLEHAGIESEVIHGNKAQNHRKRALDKFSSGHSRILVATDVAARGLDVDDVTHVINFDLPMEPEGYVHRIGRTARAGASGVAISFCDGEERGLLRDIEKILGGKIPTLALPELPKHDPRADAIHDHKQESREYAAPRPGGRRSFGFSQPLDAPSQSYAPGPKHAPRTGGHSKPKSNPGHGAGHAGGKPTTTRQWNRPTRRASR